MKKNARKRQPQHKGIWVLLIALLLALLAWGAAALFPGRLPLLSNLMGTVTAPLQRGAASVTGWFERLYSYAYEYDALVEENESLKLRLADMEQQVRQAQASERENERLRKLLELREKRADFQYESATITARGASNWSSSLTLSKGSAHGVEVNDCVVTDSGYLVGVIVEVGHNWSTAITVIDPDLELGAVIYRTEELCVAEGNFALMTENRLRLSFFPDRSSLMRGDVIVTSGRSGIYPSGLVIGTVEDVRLDDSGMTRYAVLSPQADLDDQIQVFIITDFDIVD